jgi:uncharacterized protein YoxC
VEDILYLTLLIVAIAFAITVIYIAVVLFRVAKLLKTMGGTLGRVDAEMKQVLPDLKNTLHEAHVAVSDVEEKLKSTDPLFATVENFGNSVNNINQALQKADSTLTSSEFEKQTKPYIEGIRWTETAFYLYNKWKKKEQDMEVSNVSMKHTGKEG